MLHRFQPIRSTTIRSQYSPQSQPYYAFLQRQQPALTGAVNPPPRDEDEIRRRHKIDAERLEACGLVRMDISDKNNMEPSASVSKAKDVLTKDASINRFEKYFS